MTNNPSIQPGTLYIVATPIGNLADISERAISTLKSVDMIAAEDTRHTGLLLQQLGFNKRLISYHQHNESARSQELVGVLLSGKNVALVSDAGTPAISDPGTTLVKAALSNDITVSPIPGSSAVIAALSSSGLDSRQFQFLGFLPQKKAEREKTINSIKQFRGSSIIYEAPHRIISSAEALADALGEHHCLIAREITKRFEQLHQCTLAQLPTWLAEDSNRQRGEFVLVIESSGADEPNGSQLEPSEVLKKCLSHLPLKAASKLAAELTGKPKNELYQLGLEIKQQAD